MICPCCNKFLTFECKDNQHSFIFYNLKLWHLTIYQNNLKFKSLFIKGHPINNFYILNSNNTIINCINMPDLNLKNAKEITIQYINKYMKLKAFA